MPLSRQQFRVAFAAKRRAMLRRFEELPAKEELEFRRSLEI
jgi:hypothetical protein